MTHSDRILELLYDRPHAFVLVDELAAAARLSRTQLERAIEHLRQGGFEIERSPAHGVRLCRPLPLSAHLIERGLHVRRVGRNVISFPEVDSTNDVAFDAAAQPDSDGLVVLAESQRRGRGRLGRHWVSPPRANVLLSVLLHDASARLPHEALTIAAGVATAEGVEAACGVSCRLKWPNDVLVGAGKLAGVLVEMRRSKGGRCFVVGIGINVNAAPPRDAIGAAATSLAEVTGEAVERIEVVRRVLQRLDHWVHIAGDASTTAALHAAWKSRCDMINQRLTVQCAGVRYEGRVLDVSPLEGLVLCCDSGQTVCLPAEQSTILK